MNSGSHPESLHARQGPELSHSPKVGILIYFEAFVCGVFVFCLVTTPQLTSMELGGSGSHVEIKPMPSACTCTPVCCPLDNFRQKNLRNFKLKVKGLVPRTIQ